MTQTNVATLETNQTLMAQESQMNAYTNPALFDQMQRAGKMMASSKLVPAHLQDKVADCTLVAIMSLDLKINPIMLAQNIYFVHGAPGWKTTFLISRANQSGKLAEPIQYKVKGKGDSLSVTAWARLAGSKGDGLIEATVDMDMAKADGWAKNDKYKSIPQQMLSYRAATFLIRLYMPEIMFGMHSLDELTEKGPPVSYSEIKPRPKAADFQDAQEAEVQESEVQEAEVQDAEAEESEETMVIDSFGEVIFTGPRLQADEKLHDLIATSQPGEIQAISEYNAWADAAMFRQNS